MGYDSGYPPPKVETTLGGVDVTGTKPKGNPMWPAIIAGAASLIGGAISNKSSARMAKKQMDFQEEMSSTSHQREVEDLRLAGLNPILSGTGGHGASTPSGAMGQATDIITPAVGSALAARRQTQELKLMKEQTLATAEQADNTNADTGLKHSTKTLTDRQANTEHYKALSEEENVRIRRETQRLTEQQFKTEQYRTEAEKAQAKINERLHEIYGYSAIGAKRESEIDESNLGVLLGYLRRIMDSGGSSVLPSIIKRGR